MDGHSRWNAEKTRCFSVSAVIALAALTSSAPGLAQGRDSGWWVVISSFPKDPPERQQGDLQRVSAAARRCGLRFINDDSAKFVGFQPGLNVFVVGPHGSRSQAERMQATARKCFPGAYMKRGRYMGE